MRHEHSLPVAPRPLLAQRQKARPRFCELKRLRDEIWIFWLLAAGQHCFSNVLQCCDADKGWQGFGDKGVNYTCLRRVLKRSLTVPRGQVSRELSPSHRAAPASHWCADDMQGLQCVPQPDCATSLQDQQEGTLVCCRPARLARLSKATSERCVRSPIIATRSVGSRSVASHSKAEAVRMLVGNWPPSPEDPFFVLETLQSYEK